MDGKRIKARKIHRCPPLLKKLKPTPKKNYENEEVEVKK